MKKEVVPRDDGRVIIYYSFGDENVSGVAPEGAEAVRPAPEASNSAVDSDVVTEENH